MPGRQKQSISAVHVDIEHIDGAQTETEHTKAAQRGRCVRKSERWSACSGEECESKRWRGSGGGGEGVVAVEREWWKVRDRKGSVCSVIPSAGS